MKPFSENIIFMDTEFTNLNPYEGEIISLPKQLREMYYSYPNYREKIRRYGLIALELM